MKKYEIKYELAFPLEISEAHEPPPDIEASVDGKEIYNGRPWSNPLTNLPVIRTLISNSPKIALKVKSENVEKIFDIDLNKGTYLIVQYDQKKKAFKLEQETERRGYN